MGVQEAVHVGSLDGSERSILLYASSNAVYANGHLLFVREQSLVAQPFSPDARELRGDAFPVSDLVQFNQARSRGIFSASTNGMLVYQAGSNDDARMVWVDKKRGGCWVCSRAGTLIHLQDVPGRRPHRL